MKKVIILLVAILPFVSCGERGKGKLSEKDSLQMELHAKDSLLNEVFSSLNDITANLNMIKNREEIITSSVENGEISKEPSVQIKEDIMAIDHLLQQNRETIARLEQSAAQLKRANVKIGSLEKLVAQMTAQIETKDSEIITLKHRLSKMDIELTALGMQVDDLNWQVEGLTDNKAQLEDNVKQKSDQLNTAYYIVGSRKELLDKGVVYKSGFIGRTLKLNDKRETDAFTQIDIRDFDEVILGKKNIELVTSHPEGSYEFVMDEKGVFVSLVITDKEKFWEYSKVLVLAYK